MSFITPPIIRAVTVADVPTVRATLIKTWHATYDTSLGADKVRDITTRWHSLVALTSQIGDGATFLLAEHDGQVLGSSYAKREGEFGGIQLYRLYVHPRAHGTGLGRRLMAATFAPYPDAHLHRLEVGPRNARAIRFYEREGFSKVGEIADHERIGDVEALIFERVVVPVACACSSVKNVTCELKIASTVWQPACRRISDCTYVDREVLCCFAIE